MNIFALLSLIAFMICFFLGNFIYHKNPKSQLNISIALLCILVGFLAFVEFQYRQAESIQIAYFWLKISSLWPLVPSLLLQIALIFTDSNLLKNKLTYPLIYIPPLIIIALSLTTNMMIYQVIWESWGWYFSPSPDAILYSLMALWTIFGGLLSGLIVLTYFLKSRDLKRKQAKYVFVGLYLPLFLSLTTDVIMPNISIKVPEMTMVMSTIGIGFISYGIWKYRFPALTTAIAADEIVSTMSNFFILLDVNNNIINVNKATCDLIGYKKDELIGKSIEFIFPTNEIIIMLERISSKLSNKSFISNLKSTLKTKNNSEIPVFVSLSMIKSENNEILGVVLVGSDITDIKEAEDKLKSSLKEKELLLQEVHHRVKNNLQIISSLLNLQESYIKDKGDREIFRDSQSRVKSMAFIHEQLYRSSDFEEINFADYIRSLISYLSYIHKLNPEKIKIELDVDDVTLDINTAIPCGLITNELVTNSIKYAFIVGVSGTIKVDLKWNYGNQYILIVSDDGRGLSKDIDFENTETLGLQLVNSLTKQLDGYIEIDRENGTKFKIIFNKLEYKQRI